MQDKMIAEINRDLAAANEALEEFRRHHPSARRRGITVAPYPRPAERKARRKAQKQSRRTNR